MDAVRRLIALVAALVLVASLPLAAARAGCVCDHAHVDGHGTGHDHGSTQAAAPHTCTSACTAANCPMHRAATRASHGDHDRASSPARDGIRCSCAGEMQALIGQATVAGVLPAAVTFDAPVFAAASHVSLDETPLRLAATPPAPPPRA